MTRTIAAIAVLAVLITVAAVTFRAPPPILAVWGVLGAAGIIRAHLRRKAVRKVVNLTPHPVRRAEVNRKPAIVNLTPHPLVLRDEHGAVQQTIPPSGRVARIAETSTLIGTLEIGAADVPWERKAYGTIEGLPEPEIYDAGPSMYYIVPLLTALAAKASGRTVADLLVPGQQTRDGDGTVNGCLTLASLA